MSCFMRHVTAKVAPDDAVPRWVVFFIKLLFDKRGDVLKSFEKKKQCVRVHANPTRDLFLQVWGLRLSQFVL